MNYTVSANGGTVVVSDDSEVVRYTSQSLIYGDVQVSAINSCGQDSTPALLNIPTSGTMYRLTLGCRKYTRGSYQYCARAKPESSTDN